MDKVTDMYAAQKQHRIHSTSPEKFGTCGRGMGSDEGQGTRAASCSKAVALTGRVFDDLPSALHYRDTVSPAWHAFVVVQITNEVQQGEANETRTHTERIVCSV